MKSCIVYKSKKELKIVTQSETTAGYLLHIIPVLIIPCDCTEELLLEAIFTALENSSDNLKAPERADFPSIQKELLRQLKEKSFEKLYTNSTSCEIRLNNNIMTIYPNKLMTEYRPKDGLVWVEHRKILINDPVNNKKDVAFKIRESLM